MSGVESTDNEQQNNPLPPECSFTLENLEGYVLQALDRSDQARIRTHLGWCDDCRQEADRFARVVRAFPFAAERVDGPSADAWTKLAARLTPVTDAGDGVARISTRELPTPSLTRPAPIEHSSTLPRWMIPIIAPLVMALIIVSAWGVSQHNQVGDLQNQIDAQTSLTSSNTSSGDKVRIYQMEPACEDCEGNGQLGADPDANQAVLLAWNLNPDEQHEVWCVHEDGESNLVAILNVNDIGQVLQTLEFSQPIAGYREIRVVKHEDSTPELIIAMRPEEDREIDPTSTVTIGS